MLAEVRRARSGKDEIFAYQRFHRSVAELNQWTILDWNSDAVAHFERLRRAATRIGTLDLRIACIALSATMPRC
ncbi:MAG: hypothetical protein ACOYMN_19655 [Roseimicrobium sp.]